MSRGIFWGRINNKCGRVHFIFLGSPLNLNPNLNLNLQMQEGGIKIKIKKSEEITQKCGVRPMRGIIGI
jgi:hypothetical protein